MRADARRNRERVLAAASDLLDSSGLDITLRDVASAAGVGLGTVGRHFATKRDLLVAVFADRVAELATEGARLLAAADPAGFETYFASVVAASDASQGLGQALASDGIDLSSVTQGDRDIMAILGDLLDVARRAGRIADSVRREDVKRLVTACATGDPASSARLTTLVLSGMRC